MIKILQVITLSEWGGAQRVCYDLSINLNKDKFLVEVACKPGGLLVKKLKEKGIKVYEISSFRREISPINDFKTLISLYRLIKKGKYDIVHCHSTKAGILGRIAAKLAGVRKVYFTAHGWGFFNLEEYGWAQKLLIFLERITARFSTKIICVSENTKQEGLKKNIAKEEKFLVIRNGISFKANSAKEKVREKLKVEKKDIIFGMVGRFAYPKDPLFFIKVANEIVKNYPQAKFILVGGGPLFEKCQNFVKENKLENNVFLLGEKNPQDTQELLISFDVFILISKFEGLPITIIEAMFAGLPIISSNVGGINELVKDKENGFLVKTDDLNEIIEKIIYLIKNPQERKNMGKKSLTIAKENFSLDKMVKSYEKLYQEN